MRTIHKKIEVASNPHHTSSSTHAAGKKGRKMAKAMNPKNKAANHHKRPNPFKKKYEELKKRKANAHRNSRNPSISAAVGQPSDLVMMGLAGLASAVATKQLPQMVLGTNNAGVEGYFGNAVTGVAATWAAATFIGPKAAQGALVGSLVILLDRILTDQFSSLGPYLALSGVGDATSYGKLGTIRDGYYFHPDLRDGNGNLITPPSVISDAVSAVVNQYPQLAAPVAAAIQNAPGGGGHGMGAPYPAGSRTNAGNRMMVSARFANRMNR